MTKDEALKLLLDFEQAGIDVYEFINGYHKRGKLEPKEQREFKAARAILKHLAPGETFSDEELKKYFY